MTGADEGLYALVAREWVNGHLPYTTVWETKPPVFFAILATAMLIFGKSMFALRVANDIAIACTAFALYAIGRSVRRGGHTIGLTAALLYAALTISDSGLSAVAESFYAPFVAIPLALILRGRFLTSPERRELKLFGLGVFLGCAILVKQSALLEVAYVGCVLAWAYEAAYVVPLGLGVVLSLLGSTLPYLVTRTLPLYWDANVSALGRRAFVAIPDVAPWTDVLRAQVLAFFPASLLVFGVGWTWNRDETDADDRMLIVAMTAWALVTLVTVASIREYLGNHFIGAMAPASVLSALVSVRLASRFRKPWLAAAIAALALVAHAAYPFVLSGTVAFGRLHSGDPAFGDTTAQLGRYLNQRHVSESSLYVADDRTVLYVLTNVTPPTRYAYPPHLLDRYQETVAGVDAPREIERILRQRPAYIVRDSANRRYEDPRGAELLDRALASRYRIVHQIGSRVVYLLAQPDVP